MPCARSVEVPGLNCAIVKCVRPPTMRASVDGESRGDHVKSKRRSGRVALRGHAGCVKWCEKRFDEELDVAGMRRELRGQPVVFGLA